MQLVSIRNSFCLLLFFVSAAVFSQDIGSETVVVVKPYTPSVNDAFKIKEIPAITDSINMEKKVVEYSIFSVPVASTFTPAKGRATNLERARPAEIYDNYATLGFGNYTSVLAEFYSNLEVNRTDNFGIFLTHNSAQGGLEQVELEDKYYDTELNLNYSSHQRRMSWNTEFGVEHQLSNWYGVNEGDFQTFSDIIEPQQNYFSVYAGGTLNTEESFFDSAKAQYRFFGDSHSSLEHHLEFKPTLEIPIAGELFRTNLVVDYLQGGFERKYFSEEPLNYSFLNAGLNSSILILRDNLTLNIGAAVMYSMDSENSDGGLYLYPKVTASYRMAGEYFTMYAGLEGELLQNSYYDFVEENPFVSPTLDIQPTDQQYDFYVGGKGKFTNSIGYNIKGKYIAENFKPLFVSNPEYSSQNEEGYAYGNSFSVVYDDLSTISAFGELNMDVNRNLSLRLNGEYFVYDTAEEREAWNLPDFKASFLADFQISSGWYAGANLFFVGERKDRRWSDVTTFAPATPQVVSLESYLDLNANLGYRFNEQLSAFVKGNNLLGNNYERWMDFPVLGLQVLAGVTYKFDFAN